MASVDEAEQHKEDLTSVKKLFNLLLPCLHELLELTQTQQLGQPEQAKNLQHFPEFRICSCRPLYIRLCGLHDLLDIGNREAGHDVK